MDSLLLYFGMGLTGLAASTVLGMIALKGFTQWIDLKRAELGASTPVTAPSVGARIDVADLKERVRRLEAIAAGVDI